MMKIASILTKKIMALNLCLWQFDSKVEILERMLVAKDGQEAEIINVIKMAYLGKWDVRGE